MTIDVDDILTDDDLDEYMGGQALGATTLKPVAWDDCKPARQYALDEVMRLLKRAFPKIDEVDIANTATLRRAVLLGASARLYRLAMTNCADPNLFYAMEKRDRAELNDEVRALGDEIEAARVLRISCIGEGIVGDEILANKGRGRRSVSIVRR